MIVLQWFIMTAMADEVELKLWHSYQDAERSALESLIDTYNEQQSEVEVRPPALRD